MKGQLESVVAKYPGIVLNESLLALVRSKILKKKFKDYFLACLSGMVKKTFNFLNYLDYNTQCARA